MATEHPESLWLSLSRARATAPAVAKSARNKDQSFNYAPGEDVIEACRACLATHGLSLVPTDSKLIAPVGRLGDGIVTKDGRAYGAVHAVLSSDYLLGHVSGETIALHYETPVIPGPGRPADKALFAAQTEQLAYAYRDVLGAKRGDALDVAGRGDEDEPSRAQRSYVREEMSFSPSAQSFAMAGPAAALAASIEGARTRAELEALIPRLRELGHPYCTPEKTGTLQVAYAARSRALAALSAQNGSTP